MIIIVILVTYFQSVDKKSELAREIKSLHLESLIQRSPVGGA